VNELVKGVKMFKLESIAVEFGERVDTWLPIAKRPDGSDYSLPMIIVNGTEEGPVLYLQGAVHGDELEGPAAIMDVVNSLDPKKMKGTIIGIPVVNIPGYLHKISVDVSGIRENPIDWKNLNRTFPGKEDGTITERLAHTIANKIVPLADVIVDIHSGGQRGTSIHMAGFIAAENNMDYVLKTLEIAELIPMEIIWRSSPWGKLKIVAQEKNILFTCIEVTGQGRCDEEDVEPLVIGIKNVMKHLGMIEGQPEGIPKERKYIDTETYIYATVGGLLRPKVKTGDLAKEGQIIGVLYDVHGHITEKVSAPFDCIVTGIRTKGVAWVSEPLFLVSSFISDPREGLEESESAKAAEPP